VRPSRSSAESLASRSRAVMVIRADGQPYAGPASAGSQGWSRAAESLVSGADHRCSRHDEIRAVPPGKSAMGGRHESPKPGTDVFMAVVILVLAVFLAAVMTLALLGD